MKILINLLLVALIGLLTLMVIRSIQEPIAFQAEKTVRKDAVAARLTQVRTAQELFRVIKGRFATNFDELVTTLKTEQIPFVKMTDDPKSTDPDKFIREVTYTSAIDSIKAMGINLDSLMFIPYTTGKTFDMVTDTIEYQSTQVNVIQVGTRWKEFMGDFADKKFSKYDKTYDPEKPFKFGDLGSPSLSGNWE